MESKNRETLKSKLASMRKKSVQRRKLISDMVSKCFDLFKY